MTLHELLLDRVVYDKATLRLVELDVRLFLISTLRYQFAVSKSILWSVR